MLSHIAKAVSFAVVAVVSKQFVLITMSNMNAFSMHMVVAHALIDNKRRSNVFRLAFRVQ